MGMLIRVLCGLSLCYSHATHAQTFVDVAEEANVTATGFGVGSAWGDYDGDNDLDLFVTGLDVNRLFQNEDGRFVDMAPELGMATDDQNWGLAWGDYDNDGDLDIAIARSATAPGENRLYTNKGDGTFDETGEQAGIVDEDGGGQIISWVDYNLDGRLDLYLGNNNWQVGVPLSRLYHNEGDGTFRDVAPDLALEHWTLGADWADYDIDGDPDLFVSFHSEGFGEDFVQNSLLYQNVGAGSFIQISESVGVAHTGFSLGAAWGDYDGDLDLDLYVVNNHASNILYRNDGEQGFTDVTASAGVEDEKLVWGNSGIWVDYDADGDLDLYATSIDPNPNRLFENQGDGTFLEVAEQRGVASHGGVGASWADYDADGDLDLYIPVVLLQDEGLVPSSNHLYRNDGPVGRWLSVELEGVVSNRSAIGARMIAVDGTRRQVREVDSGTGLYSQGDLAVEFGFGAVEVVDSLIIRWPSGVEQVLTDMATNQRLLVREGDDTPTAVEEVGESVPAAFALEQNYPNPFNSGTMIGFSLAELGEVELSVFNLAGQKVRSLVAGTYGPGQYRVDWDGRDDSGRGAASGVYAYRLEASGVVESRRMTLLR